MADLPPRGVVVFLNVITPGYFRVLGIPTVLGWTFTDMDALGDRGGVVVINETAARAFWPGQNPVGRRFYADDRASSALRSRSSVSWPTIDSRT